jgi:aspartate kinase
MIRKVAKFGGTSMANADTIRRVATIIKNDPAIHFVVVSAPGRRQKGDLKVTDLLYQVAKEAEEKGTIQSFQLVEARILEIAKGLDLVDFITPYLIATKNAILDDMSLPFIVSRGEYFSSLLLAKYLNYTWVDAKDCIVFRGSTLNYPSSNQKTRKLLNKMAYVVMGGFYGENGLGDIKVMERGGSDITGAIVARAIKANVYENWTDVDGFLVADPDIVHHPKLIEEMTYKELRVLSFMGAEVLHSETYYPVMRAKIPIHIRNTFNPTTEGTYISPSLGHRGDSLVTGIAGLQDFTLIVVEKELMSEVVGLDRKILSIAEKLGIIIEHFPSGTDTFSMMIESKYLENGIKDQFIQLIKKTIKPDYLEVTEDVSLISIIGRNLMANNYNMLRLFTALVNDNITLKMIDYGSSGVNIVIGVSDDDYAFAIKTLYKEFIEDDEEEEQE